MRSCEFCRLMSTHTHTHTHTGECVHLDTVAVIPHGVYSNGLADNDASLYVPHFRWKCSTGEQRVVHCSLADTAYSRQRHGMQYHVSHVLRTTACFERYSGNLSGGILLFCCSVVRGSFHITGSSILVLKLTFSPDPFPRNLPL